MEDTIVLEEQATEPVEEKVKRLQRYLKLRMQVKQLRLARLKHVV